MNRSTSSSEIGLQGGKTQWQRPEQSSVWSGGRRAFQDWRAKGKMNRPTSSSEFLYYIRVQVFTLSQRREPQGSVRPQCSDFDQRRSFLGSIFNRESVLLCSG